MADTLATLSLPGPAATDRLARRLAGILRPGDVLLLDGPVGAGKTAFARATIQAILAAEGLPPEDVPSPTFTLVQTYNAHRFEIWHADLYRLTSPDEVMELGLSEAFDTALCLIEWPDRLGPDRPGGAVTLRLSHDGPDARRLELSGSGELADRLAAALAKAPA
ncbi:tRNA (adenosine(37)-N6)-threonylcarbamoyltransferase complex ATPase subunit type 1 TsaE [Jannaschia seohaensis]|uniref:tRNA threonylcarbamoyladenosine biosynthesis protein TsaE n=1 Tax=Jannaschia seohaensis TaxID=475081 RepID=A0A2Y9A8I9_9RHOB|nr:tRNA (adenosine(37)-N6)-threonylcarbamoyltransferase complex ATPase subunit type 1 TsaE [Jannaschia seohaensis]PWJ22229.1 tRNA threonylcarbamoyladenosine biosynthesis protein TsaE [Jannaschia seohaensis]SSA38507.1 tRNA threonylcarbamoyladenosine biosynthesis protein TsaE [Jannaschia seohaensis]